MAKEYIEREAIIRCIVHTPSEACQRAWETGTHRYTEVLDRLAERQHEIIDMITATPATDVVEVVRCRECAHYHRSWCEIFGAESPTEDGFCCYGERKDGANNA